MQVATTYTFDEFKAIQQDQKHPYVGLFNMDNSRLVAFNKHGKGTVEKMKEIERALDSPSLTDGVYIIRGKNSLGKDIAPFDYLTVVGDPEIKTLNDAEPTFESKNVPVTSYQEALKSANKITALTFEIAALKKENSELTDQLKDAETAIELWEQEEPAEPGLSENKHWVSELTTWGQNIIEMLTPALDEHMKLRRKKLDLMEMRMKHQAGNPQKNGQQTKEEVPEGAVDYADKKIREYIQMHEDDPKSFETMAACYNDAPTMDDFFVTFKEHCGEEHLESLVNYMNGKGEFATDE